MNSDIAKWELRTGLPEDVQALAELERICFRKPWSEDQIAGELAYPDRSFFLLATAIQDDIEILLGSISWRQVLDQVDIMNLAVRPQSRDLGIASSLLERAFQIMGRHGALFVTLEVASKNRAAIHLYQKNDFKAVGYVENYYPESDDDAILMSRTLR